MAEGYAHKEHPEGVSPTRLPENEVRRRRPLWIALSDLWLDQELTEDDLWRVARVAAASGYSDDEVAHIHWHEVAPVVAGNLLAPVGVWSGFDEDWLCERAAQLAGRPTPRLNLTRRWAGRLIASDWRRLLELLPLARAECSS